MTLMCSAVHVAVQTVGPSALPDRMVDHVAQCVQCGDETAEVLALEASLNSLDHAAYVAPSGLHAAVMASLGPVAVPDAKARVPLAVPVAAAAFVATAAAGTAVLIRMRRQTAA